MYYPVFEDNLQPFDFDTVVGLVEALGSHFISLRQSENSFTGHVAECYFKSEYASQAALLCRIYEPYQFIAQRFINQDECYLSIPVLADTLPF